MKLALVIPDGMADEPQDSLRGKTPLQTAELPHMDEVVRLGQTGTADHVPASMPSGSDVGTMSLFGYDPLEFHTGRAPIEAAAQGIGPEQYNWAIRCNLVTIADGVMQSFTAGQIESELAAGLLADLQATLPADSPWKFVPGVSYRNLLLYSGDPSAFDKTTSTQPPHDATDQHIASFLPSGTGADLLFDLMHRSREVFAERESPATQVWLWGQGTAPQLPDFHERFGVVGGVITAVDLLRGLGKLIGWEVINVPGATGYLDTDYAAKGRAAIEALEHLDLIVVHVEATDEASHEGNASAKIEACKQIDQHVVAPLHEHLRAQGDYRLLICPDHPTFLRTKTHSHGPVPYALCGSGVETDNATAYDEPAASATGRRFDKGSELMAAFTRR